LQKKFCEKVIEKAGTYNSHTYLKPQIAYKKWHQKSIQPPKNISAMKHMKYVASSSEITLTTL
jgi:hypothetical protein